MGRLRLTDNFCDGPRKFCNTKLSTTYNLKTKRVKGFADRLQLAPGQMMISMITQLTIIT